MDLRGFWSLLQHFQPGILIGREALHEWCHTAGFVQLGAEKSRWNFLDKVRIESLFLNLLETFSRPNERCELPPCDFLLSASERLQQAQQVSSADGATDLSACACHTGVVCAPAVSPCFHGDGKATPPARISSSIHWMLSQYAGFHKLNKWKNERRIIACKSFQCCLTSLWLPLLLHVLA